jgi:hypothetical protein
LKAEGKIKGEKLPPAAPEILPFAHLYWNAYTFLSARRSYNDAGFPQYIQPTEILAYVELADIFNFSTRRTLLNIVGALEEVYIPFQTERVKTQIEAARRKEALKNRQRGSG